MKLQPLFLVFTISSLFVIPDVLYCLTNPFYKINSGWQALMFIAPLSFGLIYSKHKILNVIIISILCILQIMQFSRLSYFGRLMTQYDFRIMFDEFNDIVTGAIDAFFDHWKILAIVIMPFIGIW